MDAHHSPFSASLHAPFFLPTAGIANDSFCTHRRFVLHLTKFTHNRAALGIPTASPAHRHYFGRKQSIHVESENAESHNHKRCTSSTASDDDNIAALLARKSTFERIQSSGVIACLRSNNEEVALNAGRAALDSGVSVLEVTMRTPGASQVIKKLVHEYPAATIGAGTVLTWQDAESAKEAGATLLFSPVTNKELVQAHSNTNVLFIPGTMSPSEILQARSWGASCVKLYPISLVGGIEYVEKLKRMFPKVPIIPANGIFMDTVEGYLRVGSSAVVMSDAIFNKMALAQHDYALICRQSQLVAALAATSARGDLSLSNLN